MISAGEASGDVAAAGLVQSLRAASPGLEFFGLGGPEMEARGVELLAPSSRIAVTGLFEVLPALGRILSTLKTLKKALESRRPRALILVDFPDFNFLLARKARKLGIPVIYYIVPQIWAWRSGRVEFLKKNLSHLVVILPFEEEWFGSRGLSTYYAGHPLADRPEVGPGESAAFLAEAGLDPGRPVLALLPGSRRNEIKRTLGPIRETVRILMEKKPELQFLVPAAPGRDPGRIERAFAGLPVKVVRGRAARVLAAARAALVCSGTATLEAALSPTPLVMFYKIHPLTYFLRHFVTTIQTFSLPNLIAGRRVVPELIQDQASPRRMAAELLDLLEDGPERSKMVAGLKEVRAKVGPPGGSDRAARSILEHLAALGEGAR